MSALQPQIPTLILGRSGPRTRIAESVHRWIYEGRISPGEALPTVRQLASDFDVDKGTVVRALSHLRDAGIIERQGRRLHVAEGQGGAESASASDASPASAGAGPASSPWNGTIAVLSSVKLGSGTHRSPEWSARVVEGIVHAAHAAGRHAVVVNPESSGREELSRMVAGGPQGFIVAACKSEQLDWMLPLLDEAGLPVARFGDEVADDKHAAVSGDHCEGASGLTRWLHERGCRRVLRYWPHNHDTKQRPPWLDRRDAGFEQAAHELGLPVVPPVEFHRPPDDQLPPAERFALRTRIAVGYLAEHLLGDDPADAVMTASDAQSFEVSAACRMLGKTPGNDVLVAGYDDFAAYAHERQWESALPAVTVTHDYVELGRKLVEVVVNGPNKNARLVPPIVRGDAALEEFRTPPSLT